MPARGRTSLARFSRVALACPWPPGHRIRARWGVTPVAARRRAQPEIFLSTSNTPANTQGATRSRRGSPRRTAPDELTPRGLPWSPGLLMDLYRGRPHATAQDFNVAPPGPRNRTWRVSRGQIRFSQIRGTSALRPCSWRCSARWLPAQSRDMYRSGFPSARLFSSLARPLAITRRFQLGHCPTPRTVPPAKYFLPGPASLSPFRRSRLFAWRQRLPFRKERALDWRWQFSGHWARAERSIFDWLRRFWNPVAPKSRPGRPRIYRTSRGQRDWRLPIVSDNRYRPKKTGRKARRSGFGRRNSRSIHTSR